MPDDKHAISDKIFDDTIAKSKKPILVDFWASWCGPCQILGPIIEEIAEEVKDFADVHKVNVDENPETSGKYSIMSIPTVMIFKDGVVKETIVGVQSKDVYIQALKNNI